MTKKIFAYFFSFLYLFINGQITSINPDVEKDSFFEQKQDSNDPIVKVKIIHSDITQKRQDIFDGNTFMAGNVQLEHKGSTLRADTVIFYSEANFVKAIGNTILRTSDDNTITAGEIQYDGNTQRGIAKKNVVLTDPKQTIKTEILYYDRIPNTAYFNTGGTIYNGSNTIQTKTATYNINTKIVDVTGNVNIDNEQYRVEGYKIKQNQNTNTAEFFGPTKITNKRTPSNYVYTEKGKYKMNSKEVFLDKNSRIHYNRKVLTGDNMYYNQNRGYGTAKGNVTLNDPYENRYVKGGYGEIFENKDSAIITKNPYAVKIFDKDSLFFSAERIIAFQKLDKNLTKKSFIKAYHKARMFKSNAQGRADSLSFNETDGELHLIRKPILWTGERQVSGDIVKVFMNTKTENIDSVKIIGNALAISKVDSINLKDEFNQVKGKSMNLYYKNNNIHLIKVIENAQAINYIESENSKTKSMDRLGISISTCGEIDALFEEQKLHIVACNIGANTDVYPMSKISPEKRKFPDFNWNTRDRPRKWTDIFLDTPNNIEIVYEPNTDLYDRAEAIRKEEENKKINNRGRKKK